MTRRLVLASLSLMIAAVACRGGCAEPVGDGETASEATSAAGSSEEGSAAPTGGAPAGSTEEAPEGSTAGGLPGGATAAGSGAEPPGSGASVAELFGRDIQVPAELADLAPILEMRGYDVRILEGSGEPLPGVPIVHEYDEQTGQIWARVVEGSGMQLPGIEPPPPPDTPEGSSGPPPEEWLRFEDQIRQLDEEVSECSLFAQDAPEIRVAVQFSAGPDGKIIEATASAQPAHEPLRGCVERVFEKWSFEGTGATGGDRTYVFRGDELDVHTVVEPSEDAVPQDAPQTTPDGIAPNQPSPP